MRARFPFGAGGLALAAVLTGLLIAHLPLKYSLSLLIGLGLAALAVWEPAAGLGLAVVFGPAKAFIAVAYPQLSVDPGQIFFLLALAGRLARDLIQKRLEWPRSALWLPLGIYIAVGWISLLPAVALDEGLKESLKWIEIALAAAILAVEARRGRWKWIVAVILIAGVVQAVIGLWQYGLRGEGPEHFRSLSGYYRAYGSFEQPNPYGGFLGLIWPVAAGLAYGVWRQYRRSPGGRLAAFSLRPAFAVVCLAAVSLLCLAALYFSLSRGAWLGAAAAAPVMLLALPRRWMVGLAVTAAGLICGWGLIRAGFLPAGIAARLDPAQFAGLTAAADVRGVNISTENFSTIERLAHWQAAVAMARARPWLGVGLGNYAVVYQHFSLLNWPNALGHAHMIYLNVLAETGIIGLVTYILLWGWIIALTMRLISRTDGLRRGVAIGLLGAWTHLSVHNLTDNLYVNNVHLLIAALLALLIYFDNLTAVNRHVNTGDRAGGQFLGREAICRRLHGCRLTRLITCRQRLMTNLIAFASNNRKEAERFAKFLVVGTIGFVVDFSVFNVLHSWLNVVTWLAQTVSFTAAVISNFIWNRVWTYPDSRSKPIGRQLTQFFIVNIIGYLIRTPILLLLEWPYSRLVAMVRLPVGGASAKLGANLALMTAVIVVLLWNFFINRVWTYNDVS